MGDTRRGAGSILICGISRRSGTNYLSGLLQCHADCEPPGRPMVEDHLLRDANRLVDYALRASRRWPDRWGDREAARTELERHLGEGLLTFLSDRVPGRRVVSRTPSCDNVHLVPRLIPHAHIVVLLRDGRSAVESLTTGFGCSFRNAADEWRRGAIAALRTAASADPARVRVIRYEDLLTDLDAELRQLLKFLELDPGRFDWEAAHALPVVGSSFVHADEGRLTWRPVERPADFDPIARYEKWSAARHARFDWLAGRPQRALGYSTGTLPGGRLAWVPFNLVADAFTPLVELRDTIVAAGFAARARFRRRRERASGVTS